MSAPPSKALLTVAGFLRDSPVVQARKASLAGEEVWLFRLKRLMRALLLPEYSKLHDVPPIENVQQAVPCFVQLVQARLVVPVDKLTTAQARAQGLAPKRDVPCVVPSTEAKVGSPDAYFVWAYSKPNPFTWIYSLLLVVGVFGVLLFPLWPRVMRVGVWYVSMTAMGLIGLLFATALVRLVLYVASAVVGKGFWLFPNLFEDVGFFESFVPLYAWEGQGKRRRKKLAKTT